MHLVTGDYLAGEHRDRVAEKVDHQTDVELE
jgi:hypothetical protein